MYHSPVEKRRRRRTLLAWVAILGVGLMLAMLLDHQAWRAFKYPGRVEMREVGGLPQPVPRSGDEVLRTRDWYQLFRQVGYLPTWLAIGAAFVLVDARGSRRRELPPLIWRTGPWRRGLIVAMTPAVSGLVAEVLRVVLRRHRPGELGIYQWDWPWESHPPWGLPSSHAAVAFAGAFALSRLVPGSAPVALLLAAGCGVSRLLSGAHFLSDVYLGAVIGFATARLIAARLDPRVHALCPT